MTDTSTTTARPQNLLRVNRPYQGAYRQDLDEPENTPATPADGTAAAATQPAEPELSPEEKVYKARYDSLKAHYDKTVNEDRKRISELSTQLATASTSNKSMPKSAEELAEWRSKYPDLYGILITAMRQELQSREDHLQDEINKVTTQSAEAKREKAEASLMRLHPDLLEIKADKNFHEWVSQQPVAIQQGLYENEDDYLLAAKYIDLYKLEKGAKKIQQKPKQELRSAAQAVNTSIGSTVDTETSQGKQWKVSEISKLTRKQFEHFEEEIDQARKEGRLIIDV
jgi:hypothetical protein